MVPGLSRRELEKLIDESRTFRIVFVLTVTAVKWSRARFASVLQSASRHPHSPIG
jgi:hypothetical protein